MVEIIQKTNLSRQRLIVDVDEVVRRIIPQVINIYDELFGVKVKEENIKHWGLYNSFPNINDDEEFFRKYAERIFYEAKPEKNAVQIINKLYENHELVFASHQYKGLETLTLDWIKKHGFEYDSIFFGYDKSTIRGDLILDDGVHNLINNNCRISVRMDKSWNKEHKGYNVKNLNQFYDLVQKVQNREHINNFLTN